MPVPVSIIVPNYNHAPYLRQRLESIFNQTYQDFEVIILDDCSTDNSKEIIEEYRNRSQVSHIVYNDANSGSPFKQWAKGFDLAKGEYIWIAESDDWAENNFLAELVPILNNNSSITLTFCELFWEFPEKKILGRMFLKDKIFNGIKFIQTRQIFSNNIVNASAVLLRKKSLLNISSEYQNFQGSGDYMLWSELCEVGNLYYSAKLLNHFRRPISATTNKCISTGLTFFENHRIYNYFKNKGYISHFANYRIIENNLEQIKLNKDNLIKNGTYHQCKSLWENEKKNQKLSSPILAYCARQINKYDYLPLYAKIWKFLHLPDINIRSLLYRE